MVFSTCILLQNVTSFIIKRIQMCATRYPVFCLNEGRNVVCKPFLTTFWLVSWHWILLKGSVSILEQSIIEWLHNRLQYSFFIDFSSRFDSQHVEINCSSPILQYSPPHHHRRWMVIYWNSGNFCFYIWCSNIHLVILLVKFLYCGKFSHLRTRFFLNKFLL